MAGAVFCSPFIPLIFMGEEYAEENPFLFFVSHHDEKLIEAVRKGRLEEFSAFHQNGHPPDPQSIETFESSKLNWNLLHLDKHASMFEYYKELIALRKQSKVLGNLDRNCLDAQALIAEQTVILKRWNSEESIFCILNFSAESQIISEIIPKTALLIFNSQGHGNIQSPPSSTTFKTITATAETLLIFSQSHV